MPSAHGIVCSPPTPALLPSLCEFDLLSPDLPPLPLPSGNRSTVPGAKVPGRVQVHDRVFGESEFSAPKGRVFLRGEHPMGRPFRVGAGAVEPGPGDSSWDGPMKQSSGGRGTEGVTRTVPRVCKIRPRTQGSVHANATESRSAPGGTPVPGDSSWGPRIRGVALGHVPFVMPTC